MKPEAKPLSDPATKRMAVKRGNTVYFSSVMVNILLKKTRKLLFL